MLKTIGILSIVFSVQSLFAKTLTLPTPDKVALLLSEFEQQKFLQPLKESPAYSFLKCERLKIELLVGENITGARYNKSFTIFTPNKNKKVPVVIAVPPLMGIAVEYIMAQKLCAKGIATIFAAVNENLRPGKMEMPSWGFEDRTLVRAVVSLRTLLDYIQTSPYFDKAKVGILGSSLGGITALQLAGVESDRLQAIVTLVAGGNIPEILASSEQRRVKKLRRRRMASLGVDSPEVYEDLLRRTIRHDPLYFSHKVPKDKVLMIISNSDTAVPTANQRLLYQALGKPESFEYSMGHIPTILYVAIMDFDKITSFLDKKFN
ncbi:alpha/beta hydrolase [bacterium]|nr:alpha/beta hydrolase [bacterium]